MPRNILYCALVLLLEAKYLPAQALRGLKGKAITVTLLDAVKSNQQNGSPFEARLDRPLDVDGKVVLPKGTILQGKLTTKHARRLYRSGTLRLPDGRSAGVNLALQAIHAVSIGRHPMEVRLDDEGGIHPRLSGKKLLLNIGVSLAIGKVADDASETLIRSLSVAGARYFAWGSGAVFLLLRSKGASAKLPQGTHLDVVFQRDPVLQSPLAVLPLGKPQGRLSPLEDFLP